MRLQWTECHPLVPNHKEALCVGQAANAVLYLKNTFKPNLGNLYRFYEYSAVRMEGLKAIQDLLNDPKIKLKQAKDVRWLSTDKACQALRKILPSVITSLEREGTERAEPMAIGLSRIVKDFRFVYSLSMMCDLLPHFNRLSCLFQSASLDLLQVRPLLQATRARVLALRDNEGTYESQLEHLVEVELKDFNIKVPDNAKERYANQIKKPFIDALVKNLDDRFPDVDLLEAFTVFDPKHLPDDPQLIDTHGEAKLDTLISHYGEGVNPVIDEEETQQEWELFRHFMLNEFKTAPAASVLGKLSSDPTLKDIYPNLSKLSTICLTSPVSNAECERVFSTLKRVKTRLRSCLKNKTLNILLRISMEGPAITNFDFDTAVSKWATLRNRRISSVSVPAPPRME